MFSIVLNIAGTLMHFHMAHGLHRLPFVRAQIAARPWWIGAVVVWLVYLLGVHLGDGARDWRWLPGQFALTWLGISFVMSLCLLSADLATGFGLWWRARAPHLLALAAGAGVLLSGFGIFQATRAPAIVEYEVVMPGLPLRLDGTVLVALSDLHLGAQRRSGWLLARAAEINALAPSAVLLVGDLVEDGPVNDPRLAKVLRELRAPLGVWAVTGNHEFYGDAAATVAEFEAGGVRWLRDASTELAPGLTLAGIEDIGRTMGTGGSLTNGLVRTLAPDRQGATILLSHIPAAPLVEEAAARQVGLMVSGHTHGGQIWPFNYLVAQRFPLVAGQARYGDMTLVVSRGAGSWGPRMRLWQPGEIVKLTLRAPH